MKIREFRVRYELESANGYPVIHAIVCEFHTLKVYVDKIRDVGYKVVGIDERYREDGKFVELDEGWSEIWKPGNEMEVV